MTAHGRFHWNELNTRDPDQAKAFYGQTLGWRFEAWDMGETTYWVCQAGDQPVAGIFTMAGPQFEGIPAHWFAYVAVDDVDARVGQLAAAGGQLLRPVFEVPGVGRIAIIKDPTGAALGLITPAAAG